MEEKEGTIVSFLRENKNNLVYVTRDPSGQRAVTHYSVVRENDAFSLLRVRIDTGRKNQIRVQLREAGHPVVGDEKYGYTKNPLGRLGLHASALEFRHPFREKNFDNLSPARGIQIGILNFCDKKSARKRRAGRRKYMPFIDCRITKKLTEEKKEALKAELGRAIPLMHKSETYLMVGIADGYDLWLGGTKIAAPMWKSACSAGNPAPIAKR